MDPNEKLRDVCKRVYGQACILPCSWPDGFARVIAEMRDIIVEPAAPSPAAAEPGDEVLRDFVEGRFVLGDQSLTPPDLRVLQLIVLELARRALAGKVRP